MPSLITNNLTRRRAYLTGEIEQTQRKLKQLRSERYTIDKMLRLVDANINPNAIPGIRRHCRIDGFRQGEITRLCLGALRQAEAPISAAAIAGHIAKAKGVEVTNDILARVRSAMLRLVREGRVVRSGVHRGRLWALAR